MNSRGETLSILVMKILCQEHIEGTKSSEFRNITHSNRLDLIAQLVEHWTSKPKVVGSIPTVVKQTFQLIRCVGLSGVNTLRDDITNICFDLISQISKLTYIYYV